MKQWTQEMLPLKIIKDLGVQFATPTSQKKTRFIQFECPYCAKPFTAQPSRVANGVTTRCAECGHAHKTPKIDIASNTKECTTCLTTKNLLDFYRNTRRKDGYDSRCKECATEYKASWVATKPEYIKLQRENSRLVTRYGITSEDYLKLLESQNFSCAICGNTPEEGREASTKLSVDHCHESGKVRGLLCQKCNTGIGLLGDTKEGLQKALNYLGT